jgi:plastocyanin
MQKVVGHVQFHTARSTAFPQAAPGTPGATPGPMKVPAEMLRSTLGISRVTQHMQDRALAVVDSTLQPATQSQASGAQARKVSIGNFTFSPAKVDVAVGTKLLWVNEDDVPHTIVGTDPGSPLKSPALDTDDNYSVVLDRPGSYNYFCSLHPHMTGTVVVRG